MHSQNSNIRRTYNQTNPKQMQNDPTALLSTIPVLGLPDCYLRQGDGGTKTHFGSNNLICEVVS